MTHFAWLLIDWLLVSFLSHVNKNTIHSFIHSFTHSLTYVSFRLPICTPHNHRPTIRVDPTRATGAIDPNKNGGNNIVFAPPYFFNFFSTYICQKSLEIYCTFPLIYSASGGFIPQTPLPLTGVLPLDQPFPSQNPSSIILPNFQNGSTSMMLTQVQNTSRASV